MARSTTARVLALTTCTALLALTGSPALAADPVARASGEALNLYGGGNPVASAPVVALNDGSGETKTGTQRPPVSLLGGQNFLGFGTLAQDAQATVTDGAGSSRACAGAGGTGATFVGLGNGSTCLTPGTTSSVSAATFALSGIKIDNTGLLQGIDTQLVTALQPLLNPIDQTVQQALTSLGDLQLTFNAGAIQSSCASDLTSASGTSNLASAGLGVTLNGQRFTLVDFPANPAPNTPVTTDVDGVVRLITGALTTSLNSSSASALNQIPGLAQLLGTLGVTVQQVQAQIVSNVVAQLQAPLFDRLALLVDGTLNKQDRSGANQIEVTALELRLGEGGKAFGLASFAADVAISACGPSARVAAETPSATPTPTREKRTPTSPRVPTSVPAGLASAPAQDDPLDPWALAGLAGLVAVSLAAGVATYRTSRARG